MSEQTFHVEAAVQGHGTAAVSLSVFRWPTKGDRLFAASKELTDDAIVESHPTMRLHLMTDGYKQAADLLVQGATDDREHRDFLVFPIIFCYRHFLELSLKTMLVMYGRRVGIKPDWQNHALEKLCLAFKKMLDLYGAEDADGSTAVVAECIDEFAKIDPNSFWFRYPVDREGQPIQLELERLDLLQLRDKMTAIEAYFSGTHGRLDDIAEAAPDYEDEDDH